MKIEKTVIVFEDQFSPYRASIRDLATGEEPFCTLLHKSNKREIYIKPNEELNEYRKNSN